MEEILLVNPRRRKRRSSHAKSARRRSRRSARSHRGSGRRRRLRNPRSGGLGIGNMLSVRGATSALVPAVVGAGGALALDIGMAYLPLPDALQSGWGKTVAQLLGSLALGFIAAKVPFVGKRNAQIATLGALTIVAYNALRPLAAQTLGANVKGLSGLADFGDYTPALGAYMRPRLGAYMNPAPLLQSATSPMAAKQRGMGAYMSGSYSEDMFG